MGEQRHDGEIRMDATRMRALLHRQFPQWADLTVGELEERGTDHTLFRCGDGVGARLQVPLGAILTLKDGD